MLLNFAYKLILTLCIFIPSYVELKMLIGFAALRFSHFIGVPANELGALLLN